MFDVQYVLGAFWVLQTRAEDPSLSACPAGFDPEGGAPGQLRTGRDRQLLLDVFPVGFNRFDA